MAYRRLLFGISPLSNPSSSGSNQWHFQGDDYTRLPVVDNYEYLRSVRIPDGVYSSAKGNLTKASRIFTGMDGPSSDYDSSPAAMHSGWVTPTWSTTSRVPGEPERPQSSSSSSSSSPANAGYPSAAVYQHNGSASRRDTPLPRLSTIAPIHQLPSPPSHANASPTTPYSPLTAEDRRALSSFRVVL